MAEETATEERSLEATPTWAVATVSLISLSTSFLLEFLIDLLAKYFHKKGKKAVVQALEKIKLDLQLLEFMSLLLTVGEKRIAKIFIPKSVAETFLPCSSMSEDDYSEEELKCQKQGKVSLLSREGANELQYLIFVLALFYSLSWVLTFSLGMAKMRRWDSWEAETRTLEYQYTNDPQKFQLFHRTSFGRRHLKFWSEHRLLRWLAFFLRQFYKSVSRTDYLTLRHGFIMAHFAEARNFDFQKYIKRALERDFGSVAGRSSWIWIFSVLFLFFNADGFYNYLWLPFIPLVMLLLVGTKLQAIISKMCLNSHNKSNVVSGTLLVRPSDHFFWFKWPKLLLHLIHLILFQNSFQLAFFTWTWYEFGLRSCFHGGTEDIAIRLVLGVLVPILCGYVTLPLYALVTEMGLSMKKAVFTESVVQGLKSWRHRAKKNLTTNYPTRPSVDASLDSSPSVGTSPSFTHDASYSIESDLPLEEPEYVADEIDEEKVITKKPEEHQKMNSFEGFDAGNSKPILEEEK